MASSPSKHLQPSQLQQPASPRSPGRLRKLQSAHQLSTHYSNSAGPSLISQQRYQQQRNVSAAQTPPVPPLPAQHSPQRQTRTRSNSDNGPADPAKLTASPRRPIIPRKIPVSKDARHELESLIRQGPKDNVSLALQNLRHWILCDGIVADHDGMSHVRIYAWLILLNAAPVSTDAYLDLTRRGPSSAHAKICDDTFRTFKTNPLFKRRVTDNSLVRLLNATAWKLSDARGPSLSASRVKNTSSGSGSPELQPAKSFDNAVIDPVSSEHGKHPEIAGSGVYVQGMNVLCAPFLYVARSEAEAFAAFYRFISRDCPGYVRGAMDGVHKGVALVDRSLAIVDPKLSSHLLSKGVKAEIYAFASVLTMCAATPPLQEVLHVWDFLFAYGAHLNILCICAQLIMMKEDLLASASPGMLLRSFPQLDAKKIIMLTVALVPKIPDDLYNELALHAQ